MQGAHLWDDVGRVHDAQHFQVHKVVQLKRLLIQVCRAVPSLRLEYSAILLVACIGQVVLNGGR